MTISETIPNFVNTSEKKPLIELTPEESHRLREELDRIVISDRRTSDGEVWCTYNLGLYREYGLVGSGDLYGQEASKSLGKREYLVALEHNIQVRIDQLLEESPTREIVILDWGAMAAGSLNMLARQYINSPNVKLVAANLNYDMDDCDEQMYDGRKNKRDFKYIKKHLNSVTYLNTTPYDVSEDLKAIGITHLDIIMEINSLTRHSWVPENLLLLLELMSPDGIAISFGNINSTNATGEEILRALEQAESPIARRIIKELPEEKSAKLKYLDNLIDYERRRARASMLENLDTGKYVQLSQIEDGLNQGAEINPGFTVIRSATAPPLTF